MNSQRRIIATGFIILATLSLNLVNHAYAVGPSVNLPSTPVTIEVYNGTVSYFQTLLSGVPSGYDVTNGTYFGWCVDRRYVMTRAPATHNVTLYSSNNPPSQLATQKWDMVNYILNHKQGNATDIQQAIWYFINLVGNYTPTSPVAWAIINDTKANGSGFIPTTGQIIAVICYTTTTQTQNTIIEVTIYASVPEFPSIVILLPLITASLVAAIAYKRNKLQKKR